MTLLRSSNFAAQVKIGILGISGRMGQAIAAEIATREDCVLAGGAGRDNVDAVMAASDVVIDFTSPDATPELARRAAKLGKPFMSGTTGLGEGIKVLQEAAAKIPVFYAPNTSLSLAATKQIVTLAAKLLNGFDYDIAIHDEHHRMKKDAPSGTALALGQAVAVGNGGTKKPSYSAVRSGSIVGEHEVSFVGHDEVIRIHHSVTDRRVFARGALQAALWLHDKPKGFYGMDDLLKL